MDVGPARQPCSPLAFPSGGLATLPMLGTVPHKYPCLSSRNMWKRFSLDVSNFTIIHLQVTGSPTVTLGAKYKLNSAIRMSTCNLLKPQTSLSMKASL